MKSIAVGCRKMGYIVKTSSIYRKPANKAGWETVSKVSKGGCTVVTENGSSSPNGVADLVAGQRRRRRWRRRWKWGIGMNRNEVGDT
jgi:hypothetical protein